MKTFTDPAINSIYGRHYCSREQQRALSARAKDELLTACAQAFCIAGPQVLKDPTPIEAWFPTFRFGGYPSRGAIDYHGGGKAIRDRIRRGGLSVADDLKPWSPDLLFGLRLAGAIRRETFRQEVRHQVWIPTHRALVDDLMEAMTLPRRVKVYATTPRVCRLSRCPALLLPPDDANGAGALAGLLCGAETRILDDGEEWLLLPAADEVVRLLERWTIRRKPIKFPRRRPMVAVSPFYGALVAHLMPPRSEASVLNCGNPGLGETLALAYWEFLFADRGQRLPPFAGALPFAMSPRTFRRRGIDRSQLHRQAVCEHGLVEVAPGLRGLLRRWHQAACEMRQSPPQATETVASEDIGQPIVPTQSAPAPAV